MIFGSPCTWNLEGQKSFTTYNFFLPCTIIIIKILIKMFPKKVLQEKKNLKERSSTKKKSTKDSINIRRCLTKSFIFFYKKGIG